MEETVTLPPKLSLYDRPDGSFYYPPVSATAEHCIRFWSEVEIPDEAIARFTQAYGVMASKALENGDEPLPSLNTLEIRSVIRAVKMCVSRPDMERFPEETDKVLSYPVQLLDGEKTVADIFRQYRIRDIYYQSLAPQPVQDPNAGLVAAIENMRKRLEGHLGTIASEAHGLRQDFAFQQ